jgi:hypothetical protein
VRAAKFRGYAAPTERKLIAAAEIVLKAEAAAASLALSLARNRLGMAIAANKAIIATTIMISTSVKPLFFLMKKTPSLRYN